MPKVGIEIPPIVEETGDENPAGQNRVGENRRRPARPLPTDREQKPAENIVALRRQIADYLRQVAEKEEEIRRGCGRGGYSGLDRWPRDARQWLDQELEKLRQTAETGGLSREQFIEILEAEDRESRRNRNGGTNEKKS